MSGYSRKENVSTEHIGFIKEMYLISLQCNAIFMKNLFQKKRKRKNNV